jgi:predicted ArsR family transcriptional regulator
MAGRLLARAVTEAERDAIPVADALARAARETGRSLGQQVRQRAGPNPSAAATLAALGDTLEDCGYEPRPDSTGMTLANCPFHALAQDFTDLVCGMNLDLINGLLDCDGCAGVHAVLDPAPGRCCVRLATTIAQPNG